MANITINSAQLTQALSTLTAPYFNRLASQVASRARALAPRESGELQASITTSVTPSSRGPVYHIEARSPHAAAAESGTRPHRIYPRSAGALHFFWGNAGGVETLVPRGGGFKTHRTKDGILIVGKGYIDHPGTAATHFLTRALAEVVRGG